MTNFTTCDFIPAVIGFMYCNQITEDDARDMLRVYCDSFELTDEMLSNFNRGADGAYKQADTDDLLIDEFNEFLKHHGYEYRVKKTEDE